MKYLSILIIVIFITSCDPGNKIHVTKRSTAMQLSQGLVILSTDSLFEFKDKKYLIKTTEFFDENGELNHASLWSVMGYENWSKSSMVKIKYFLDDYDLSNYITASMIDDRHIKINSDIFLIKEIDKTRKIIYYNVDKDQNPNKLIYLHTIFYK